MTSKQTHTNKSYRLRPRSIYHQSDRTELCWDVEPSISGKSSIHRIEHHTKLNNNSNKRTVLSVRNWNSGQTCNSSDFHKTSAVNLRSTQLCYKHTDCVTRTEICICRCFRTTTSALLSPRPPPRGLRYLFPPTVCHFWRAKIFPYRCSEHIWGFALNLANLLPKRAILVHNFLHHGTTENRRCGKEQHKFWQETFPGCPLSMAADRQDSSSAEKNFSLLRRSTS